MQDGELDADLRRKIGRHALAGLALVAALVFGVAGWAWSTTISGAVIAAGRLVVETSTKAVQHHEGGIVKQIFVRDGDEVDAGEVVILLDDTIVRASLELVRRQLEPLVAREARLVAESESAEEIDWTGVFADDNAGGVALMYGQNALLASRRASIAAQVSQIEEQIGQAEIQITGLTAQRDATAREIDIIADEVKDLAGLRDQGLVSVGRYNELRRQSAGLEGQHGRLVADIARTRETISERRIQIIRLKTENASEALSELQDTRASIAQLREREIAAIDRLSRIEIRAPLAGFVNNLAVHTEGGVIAAGATVMDIVPHSDHLVIEAYVSPGDIDQVAPDQLASVRFTSLDQRTTPEIGARVITVSADVLSDPESGVQTYRARLALDEDAMELLGTERLRPGMPAEAFIRTADRSVLSYLIKPMSDQMAHAFRED